MTFTYIVLKNLKANLAKYIAYFLCCAFSITVLFVFLNLRNNTSLAGALQNKNIDMLLRFSTIILLAFMTFFISYALVSFLKSRNKEFGLYLLTGLTRKELVKIIAVETVCILCLAMIAGFVFGTVFSWVVIEILSGVFSVKDIAFQISLKSFAITVIIFLALFIFELVIAMLYSKRLEITDYFRNAAKPENIKRVKPLPSILFSLAGIILLVLSLINLRSYISGVKSFTPSDREVLRFLVFSLAGVLLIIYQFGNTLLSLSKKMRKIYYSKLLSITEIRNKFNQNRKVIFAMTMLGILTIIFIGAAYSMLADIPIMTETHQPYDIVYPEFIDNPVDETMIKQVLAQGEARLTEENRLAFLYAERYNNLPEFNEPIELSVISDEEYNRLTGKSIRVHQGEILALVMDDAAPVNHIFPYDVITLRFGGVSFDYKFAGEEHDIVINRKVQPSLFMMIVNSNDYERMYLSVDSQYIGVFHLLKFDNWKKTGEIAAGLDKLIRSTYSGANEKPFKSSSRLAYYESLKQEGAMRLFVISFMGLLFLVCTSCVLYFKIFSDMESTRIKYRKLKIVGITWNEFRKILSGELKIIYFFPFLLSSAAGYAFIRIATLNSKVEDSFRFNTPIVIGAYFIFQLVYYLASKSKYARNIIKV